MEFYANECSEDNKNRFTKSNSKANDFYFEPWFKELSDQVQKPYFSLK